MATLDMRSSYDFALLIAILSIGVMLRAKALV